MPKPNTGAWLLIVAVVLVPVLPWLAVGPFLEPWAAGVLAGTSLAGMARPLVAALGLGLLAGDCFLPIPSTLVMSALGLALGPWWGGGVATLGVFLSGSIAYWVCRRWGLVWARRIAGEQGLARVADAMRRNGPLVIAATRSVPVVQEATACLAGVVGLPARLFFPALAVGCVPTGFAYAAIGASAVHSAWWAAGLSLAVPLLTWPLIYLAVRGARRNSAAG